MFAVIVTDGNSCMADIQFLTVCSGSSDRNNGAINNGVTFFSNE